MNIGSAIGSDFEKNAKSCPEGGVGRCKRGKSMGESDKKLLQQFLRRGDEGAFREFVGRYAGLVQQVALRRTGRHQLAEEVSQNVFCAVVRKAEGLCKHPERIPGWLHRAALFESSKVMRKESSFQKRKKMQHPDDIPETGEPGQTAWALALPQLDSALDRLSDSERQLILQHYFEGQTFPQIGAQQSRPAGTVQKQCRRAVEKLATLLKKKGAAVSATTVAAGLSPQLAEATSPAFVKMVSTHALLESANYSSAALSIHLFMKTKTLTTTCLVLILTPLALQQLVIARDWSENRKLKKEVAEARLEASQQPSKSSHRAAQSQRKWKKFGEVTVEQLQQALEQGEEQGRMKFLQFKDLVASLGEEELKRLLPGTLALPRRQGREDLFVYLVRALTEFDPEATVRLVTKTNDHIYAHYDRSLNQALFLWVQKEPEEVMEWFLNQGSEKGKRNQEQWPKIHQAIIAGVLIEEGSPRVREILTLNSELHPASVLADAFEPQSGGTVLGFPTVMEEVERLEAFLPWIREFGKNKSRGEGKSRSELMKQLLWDINLVERIEVIEPLLDRGQLLPPEREVVIQRESERLLRRHFNGGEQIEWATAQENTRDFLEKHDPQNVEAVFQEGIETVLKQERRQVERVLESREEVREIRDSDLSQDLQRNQLHLFPDLLERAFVLAERIQDPLQKKETLDYLKEQNSLRKGQP